MKKLKVTLPIAAFVLAIALSAFTHKPELKKVETLETLYWFTSPYNGSNYKAMATAASEESATGCLGSAAECERGFRQNQLVNGNPTQGVISTQKTAPVDIINQN